LANVVMAHAGLSPKAIHQKTYLLGPADGSPPADLVPRLQASLEIPFLEAWAGPVWEVARNPEKHGLQPYHTPIIRLPSEGSWIGYKVETDRTDKWLDILKCARRRGTWRDS
jgi:hypothetical protein